METEPQPPLDGMARDLRLVSDVSVGLRVPVMRLWQPDRSVILTADGESCVSHRTDVALVERLTPGRGWLASGSAAIMWSTIATREMFGISGTEDPRGAACGWVLGSLRQMGLQASLELDGTISTPMGVVGACAVTRVDGVILAQGIIDYASDGIDCLQAAPTENVRSQSGLPLPLVFDRFARMARTLFRVTVVSPSSGSVGPQS